MNGNAWIAFYLSLYMNYPKSSEFSDFENYLSLTNILLMEYVKPVLAIVTSLYIRLPKFLKCLFH